MTTNSIESCPPRLGIPHTEKQMTARRRCIGASEIHRVMEGNWHDLYLEKTEKKKPADLTDNFAVQLGTYTEKFNLHWLMTTFPQYFSSSDRIHNSGKIVFPPQPTEVPSFLRATPDGLCTIDGVQGVLDCKHTHSDRGNIDKYATREERVIDTYKWQMQQQMLCTGRPIALISPIYGISFGPPIILVENKIMQEQIIDRATRFWDHVMSKVPPTK